MPGCLFRLSCAAGSFPMRASWFPRHPGRPRIPAGSIPRPGARRNSVLERADVLQPRRTRPEPGRGPRLPGRLRTPSARPSRRSSPKAGSGPAPERQSATRSAALRFTRPTDQSGPGRHRRSPRAASRRTPALRPGTRVTAPPSGRRPRLRGSGSRSRQEGGSPPVPVVRSRPRSSPARSSARSAPRPAPGSSSRQEGGSRPGAAPGSGTRCRVLRQLRCAVPSRRPSRCRPGDAFPAARESRSRSRPGRRPSIRCAGRSWPAGHCPREAGPRPAQVYRSWSRRRCTRCGPQPRDQACPAATGKDRIQSRCPGPQSRHRTEGLPAARAHRAREQGTRPVPQGIDAGQRTVTRGQPGFAVRDQVQSRDPVFPVGCRERRNPMADPMTTQARFPLPPRGRTASGPGGKPVTLPGTRCPGLGDRDGRNAVGNRYPLDGVGCGQ